MNRPHQAAAGSEVGIAFVTWLREGIHQHRSVYTLALIIYLTAAIVTAAIGRSVRASDGALFVQMVIISLVLLAFAGGIAKFIHLAVVTRPQRPTMALAKWLMAWVTRGDRLANAIHCLVSFYLVLIGFSALKEAIPAIVPFAFDSTFMHLDRAVHLGHDPWRLLQPLLGTPMITAVLNMAYNAWFFVMFICLFWQGFATRGNVLRTQFLLAFALTWFVGGNIMATAASSAGPAFYGALGLSPNPYADLLAYLHSANESYPVFALKVQDMLWAAYTGKETAAAGISAMPSMHVATSVLFALMAWRVNRWAGVGLWVFAAVIMLGSVHLAWHYAIDGYVGALVAVGCWQGAGIIARRNEAA